MLIQLEEDRERLRTELECLRCELAESRDVTAAECRQLAESLSAAELTTAQLRAALCHKVGRHFLAFLADRTATQYDRL